MTTIFVDLTLLDTFFPHGYKHVFKTALGTTTPLVLNDLCSGVTNEGNSMTEN